MNNKKIGFVIVGIVVLVAVFYGGVSYGKSHATSTQSASTSAFGGGAGGFRGARAGGATGAGGGFTIGQILSKDATSITVGLTGGGSKIVFFDSSTKISKTVDGTQNDLTTGTEVSISGTANSDGSMNATSVQIRPNIPTNRPVTPTATPVVQ
jgi:hypothetical protein